MDIAAPLRLRHVLLPLLIWGGSVQAQSSATYNIGHTPAAAPTATATAPSFLQSIDVTNTLVSEYRVDNRNGQTTDDNYRALQNRITLMSSHDKLTAQLRVDAALFHDAPVDAIQSGARLERASVQYDLGNWQLTGGDYYQQLGRGIVLSVRKADEAGVDLAIRGALAVRRTERNQTTMFAGVVNPANIDAVSQKHVDDANDTLVGVQHEFRPVDKLTVGGIGLYAMPRERLLNTRDETLNGGLYVESTELFDFLTLYVEADAQRRTLAAVTQRGLAGYATIDAHFGNTTVLSETLWLDDFEQLGSRNTALGNRFSYNRPPTLERINDEVASSRNVVGQRVRVERFIEAFNTTAFANLTWRANDYALPSALQQLHGFAGFDTFFQQGRTRLTTSGGYRHETQQNVLVRTIGHVQVDYVQALYSRLSMHWASTSEWRTLASRPFRRGTAFLGIDWAGLGEIGAEFGYDTQNPSAEVRRLFLAGLLTVTIKNHVQVRALVGSQRGGIKCVSGVCRDFPEFAGARAEVIARF